MFMSDHVQARSLHPILCLRHFAHALDDQVNLGRFDDQGGQKTHDVRSGGEGQDAPAGQGGQVGAAGTL
jgi:hypothetical protein